MAKILFATEIAFRLFWTDACPSKNWICSSSPPRSWQSFAQVRRRSCRAMCSKPALRLL